MDPGPGRGRGPETNNTRKPDMTRLRKLMASMAIVALLALGVAVPVAAHSAGHSRCESSHGIVADAHAPGYGHSASRSGGFTIKYHYQKLITGWYHIHNSANDCR